MFHERTYAHLSEGLTQWLAVVAFVRGKGLQLASVPAGELRTHLCVASFTSRRTVNVKDRLGGYINGFRRFNGLHAVVRAVAWCLLARDRS